MISKFKSKAPQREQRIKFDHFIYVNKVHKSLDVRKTWMAEDKTFWW